MFYFIPSTSKYKSKVAFKFGDMEKRRRKTMHMTTIFRKYNYLIWNEKIAFYKDGIIVQDRYSCIALCCIVAKVLIKYSLFTCSYLKCMYSYKTYVEPKQCCKTCTTCCPHKGNYFQTTLLRGALMLLG
jgi:hypothetical protein